MDPITTFFAGIAAAIARAMLAEVIADLPLILIQLRTVNTSTQTDAAPIPKPLADQLNQEAADALARLKSASAAP